MPLHKLGRLTLIVHVWCSPGCSRPLFGRLQHGVARLIAWCAQGTYYLAGSRAFPGVGVIEYASGNILHDLAAICSRFCRWRTAEPPRLARAAERVPLGGAKLWKTLIRDIDRDGDVGDRGRYGSGGVNAEDARAGQRFCATTTPRYRRVCSKRWWCNSALKILISGVLVGV